MSLQNESVCIVCAFICFKVQRYHRDADETKDWIVEKKAALQTEELGKDLPSVQRLLRKHEGIERDLAALGDKVRVLDETASRLMQTHQDQAEPIYNHQTEINELWNQLTAQADARKSKLLESFDLQRFLSDFKSLPILPLIPSPNPTPSPYSLFVDSPRSNIPHITRLPIFQYSNSHIPILPSAQYIIPIDSLVTLDLVS